MNTLELLALPVKNIMNTDVITVKTKCNLIEVDNIFKTNKIHHIPVVDDSGKLAGLISYSDILLLKDWGTKLGLEHSKIKNQHILISNLAEDIMTKNLVTVSPDESLENCVSIFKENYFHALPIVENSKLVGIITVFDLMLIAYRVNPSLKS